MKKIVLALTVSIIGICLFAQTNDYVNKTEFQENSKQLKAQVNTVKNFNTTINTEVLTLKSNVSEQNVAIKEIREVQKNFLDSINKTNNTAVGMQSELQNNNTQINVITIALIISFILSLLFAFSVYFKLDKRVKKLTDELENTNALLLEHDKAQDKKISEVSHEINKLEKAVKKLEKA